MESVWEKSLSALLCHHSLVRRLLPGRTSTVRCGRQHGLCAGSLRAPEGNPGNLFFSPYSISTALAMTYAGARGDTEKQMSKVFHFDTDQSGCIGVWRVAKHLSEYSKQKGIELSIANALWTEQAHPFLPDFLRVAKENYRANLNQTDFKTQADAAREQINQWVSQITKDRFKYSATRQPPRPHGSSATPFIQRCVDQSH